MERTETSGRVTWSGFLTPDQHRVRLAFVAAIRDECDVPTAMAMIQAADARLQRGVHMNPDLEPPADLPFGGERDRISRDELQESLLFYRRRLASKIAVAMLTSGWDMDKSRDVAAAAEDYANAITERLAARETGDPNGYK